MITIGYLADDNNMWKTDEDLNVLIQFNGTEISASYLDMYWISSNSSIYVASRYLNSIDTFDSNLNLVDTFSTATLCSPVTISDCMLDVLMKVWYL